MQYNPQMTDLVFAIRARLCPSDRLNIKTSNPELLGDLADIYHLTQDTTLRAYIEQLMLQAGSTWVALLHKKTTNPFQTPCFVPGNFIVHQNSSLLSTSA